MKVSHFLNALEYARVHAAIKEAEAGTSGDMVVYVARKVHLDVLADANRKFKEFRLDASGLDNNLLIYIAPKSQTFAVVGGGLLHQKVGQAWWDDLSALLTQHFKKNDYTGGLVAAVERAGVALKLHFPGTDTDRRGQRDIVEE